MTSVRDEVTDVKFGSSQLTTLSDSVRFERPVPIIGQMRHLVKFPNAMTISVGQVLQTEYANDSGNALQIYEVNRFNSWQHF